MDTVKTATQWYKASIEKTLDEFGMGKLVNEYWNVSAS
jgi:hypothetical protein